MSSTPADIDLLKDLWNNARGSVLLLGLGLGCDISLIRDKSDVNDITVIEKEADVIRLVAGTYVSDKVKIIEADALDWKTPTGKIYDTVWIDIFNYREDMNYSLVEKLILKYSSYGKWIKVKF